MIGQEISTAAEYLKNGEVIAIPTETVYGLAANAFDTLAVAKIFEIKNRPRFNPLIVHIKDLDYIHTIANDVDERLMHLLQVFSPGPLTILVHKKPIIPDIVTAGSPKVAIRIPNHPLTLQLLKKLDFPLAAPSANPFQYISPTSAQQVEEQLGNKIPYILDGGKCLIGIESTIVGIENNIPVIYRLGGISVEEIEREIGNVIILTDQPENKTNGENSITTPGQLKKHYAPKKQLLIGTLQQYIEQIKDKKIAYITYGKENLNIRSSNVTIYNLSETQNLLEAASKLFEILYLIDQSDAEIIVAKPFPNKGLGRSINDRLKRAATP